MDIEYDERIQDNPISLQDQLREEEEYKQRMKERQEKAEKYMRRTIPTNNFLGVDFPYVPGDPFW